MNAPVKRAPFTGRSTFAVLASSVIHGALTLVITGLPASATHRPEPEMLAIEMLAPEEPAPPPPAEPPPEPAPVEEPPEPPSEPLPPEPQPTPEPDVPPPEAPPEPEVTEEPVEPETQDTDSSAEPDADPPGLDPSAAPDPLLAGDAGTGFAVRAGGRGSGRGRSGPKNVPRREVKRAPPPAPAPVPFRDLSQRPKPPALDALLERNYPAGARQQGRTGSARVALLIGTDGKVRSVRVVSASEPEFGAACARTLRQSRWSPPRDDEGKAVPTIAPYECRFRVER